MSIDRREDAGDFYPGGKVISTRPVAGGGNMKHEDFADVGTVPQRFTDDMLKDKINEVIGLLKGPTAAVALLLGVTAYGAGVTVHTAPKGGVYNDEPIVTNVTWSSDGLATPEMVTNIVQDVSPAPDFSTNNVELVKTIEAKAPIPTWDTLSGKPTLAPVATSGAYSDLSGKPTIPTTAADVGALSINGGTLNGGVTVWGDSTFYGNVFSFSDTFKIKFMDSVMTPYFEIFGYDINLPLQNGTLALISDIPTSMAWSAITGKPTTISGYGITDALKSDFTSLTNNAAFTSAVAAVSPPTDLTHVEAEIETNRTAIATLSARAYIEVVSADEVYYVFTTNQE